MEIKAKLVDASRSFSGGFRLTFETSEDIRSKLELLSNTELRITALKWREKRSKSANAYYYTLLGKMAQSARCSVSEVHNRTIAEYGQPEGVELLLREDVNWLTLEQMHLKPIPGMEVAGDQLYCRYMVMRGSHTYDTAEMSALISGTIEDAKALGIETLTPRELEEMMKAYEAHQKHNRG